MRSILLGIFGLHIALTFHPAMAQDREARPAVVHPVAVSPHRAVMSLDGEWEFAIDPEERGEDEGWFQADSDLPGATKIRVPGCWEAQGIGGRGDSRPTTPERAVYPLRGSYLGAAWYRKTVDVPSAWEGKRLWLKIGGVNAQGWFWVNGTPVAHVESFCGTYKYDITGLAAPGGSVTVAAKVSNDVLSGKGLFNWLHRFGGLYRSVEIQATSDPYIDYAYVDGDWDSKAAHVHLIVRSIEGGLGELSLHAEVKGPNGEAAGTKDLSFELAKDVEQKVLSVPLDPFLDWSPAYPNLYEAHVVLMKGGEIIDGWVERFGVRKFEIKGSDFYLNGRRFYMRAYGDDHIYPITLCSPASHKQHRRHLETARSYGFNFVRLHTHCEVPEFFEMADEIGIMVQPELPYYGPRASAYGGRLNAQDEPFFRPAEDLEELVRHYRRHVSLAVYCTGNEGHLGAPLDEEMYKLAKGLDPTRLVLHQDGGWNRENNSDFDNLFEWQWEPVGPARSDDRKRPLTLHEYLNLAVEIDPRLEGRYTGAVLPPRPLDNFKGELQETGVTWHWAEVCLESGRHLQKFYQKQGLERARKDPRLDGYVFWTILDVDCFSSQGLLDQFWEPKAMARDEFYMINGPTALLADPLPEQAVWQGGEELGITWSLSHFGMEDIRGGRLLWNLSGRETSVSGEVPGINIRAGTLSVVGISKIALPRVTRPARMKLQASIADRGIKNAWDLWIFPERSSREVDVTGLAANKRVHHALKNRFPGLAKLEESDLENVTLILSDRVDQSVLHALAQGKSVLLLDARNADSIRPGVKLGWWWLGTQSGTAVAGHIAYEDFPHNGFLSPAFFRLVNWATPVDRDLRSVEPLMLGSGRDGYVIHTFAAMGGKARLLATGLDLLSDLPEARYLLDRFILYLQRPDFQTAGVLSTDVLQRFAAPNGWQATIRASEETDSYPSYRGPAAMWFARQSDGAGEVVWKSARTPAGLPGIGMYTLQWIGATGFVSQPSGAFTLYLGERALLEFDVTLESRTWKSADGAVTLEYEVRNRDLEDSSGIMSLTVPCSWLIPGEEVTLRVAGSADNSRRWFGVYAF